MVVGDLYKQAELVAAAYRNPELRVRPGLKTAVLYPVGELRAGRSLLSTAGEKQRCRGRVHWFLECLLEELGGSP